MLKLIKCEFWKLKRKRLLYALMSLSLFFPLILAYMAKAGTGADTTEHYLQTRFDYVYTMMLGYGLVFLLPCLIGIIAAILFFIERDCDTSKNLRTIPVTNTQLIMAKISMLCTDPQMLDQKSNDWRSIFLWLNIVLNLKRK